MSDESALDEREKDAAEFEHKARVRASEPPARFKPQVDWTVEDIVQHRETGEKPETDEYRRYRAEVLERAGLTDDTTAPALEDMSVEDHARRKYGTN